MDYEYESNQNNGKGNAPVKNRRKPVQKRGPVLNIGIVVFVFIGAYIIYCFIAYLRSNPVAGYEVRVGSLTEPATFTALVIRDEEVITAEDAGHVNYYIREAERVSVGDLVYSIDPSGEIAERLKTANTGENTMSDDDFNEIRNEIVSFTKDFSRTKFTPVYDFKYNLQSTTLKLSNLNLLNSIDSIGGLGNSVKMHNATKSGYVVFNTDSYEGLKAADVTEDSFKNDKYEKNQMANNEIVTPGDPVYKIINSEDWQIVIQTDDSTAQRLNEEGTVTVKFLKNQLTCPGSVDIVKHGMGTFVIISFRSYVSSFATDRFMDVEIIMEEKSGLKIPNTAVVEKEFFLIPEEFGEVASETAETGSFGIQSYTDKGQLTTQYLELEIYEKKDGFYYISAPEVELGTVFVKSDSQETYTASRKGSLIGVYNINKGYADFRQITIQYQNEEYSIVTPNSNYGLRAYDYIVLNASAVNDDELVFEKMAK